MSRLDRMSPIDAGFLLGCRDALRGQGVEVECPSRSSSFDEPHWFLARLTFPDGSVFVLNWDDIDAVTG